jgi:hypothetical protein
MTRAQFARAIRGDEKWVENTGRALGRRLTYTLGEARWMGLVRLLAHDLGFSVSRAAELATVALQHPPETRALALAETDDGSVSTVIDLARYHSTHSAALSAALHHGGPRQRGRPAAGSRRRPRHPIAAAEAYGVDVSLLRDAVSRPSADRLARLDANASFVRSIRPARSATR